MKGYGKVMSRLDKQMEFIMEVDKIKTINRQTYITGGVRKENDAEHSWHLALMALLLSEYANDDIDVLKTMSMVLIHDMVEIDAGDTYAFDSVGAASKEERELKAADRIFNILPKDQAEYFRKLWDEFEEGETMESKFANALDKIQPILLHNLSDGKSWREHKVTLEQILKRNEFTKDGSASLWDYTKEIIDDHIDKKNIIG
jgi:putative hydrolase of HD superfamily